MSSHRSMVTAAAPSLASETRGNETATILLRGGHSWRVVLDAEGTLQELSACLANPGAERGAIVLRRADGASLTVHPREIVGIVAGEDAEDAGLLRAASQTGRHIRAEGNLPGSPYFVVENFLSPSHLENVLAFALRQKERFAESTVTSAATDYRRSKVLYEVQGLLPIFMPQLQALMPTMWPLLKMAPIPIADIECQLTAHGAGDFFKLHNDNGAPESARRVASYVFYFNRAPKKFSGGELRMYETDTSGGLHKCGKKFTDIVPRHNSLVVFPSHCHHEVLPIVSDSAAFEDRRFTVNGWLVRAA